MPLVYPRGPLYTSIPSAYPCIPPAHPVTLPVHLHTDVRSLVTPCVTSGLLTLPHASRTPCATQSVPTHPPVQSERAHADVGQARGAAPSAAWLRPGSDLAVG